MNQALFIDIGEQSVIRSQCGNKLFLCVLLKCAICPSMQFLFSWTQILKIKKVKDTYTFKQTRTLTGRREVKWKNSNYSFLTWFCKDLGFSETQLKFNQVMWIHQAAGKHSENLDLRINQQREAAGRIKGSKNDTNSWGQRGRHQIQQSASRASVCRSLRLAQRLQWPTSPLPDSLTRACSE